MISMTPANNNCNPSNNVENVHHNIHIDSFDITCDSYSDISEKPNDEKLQYTFFV